MFIIFRWKLLNLMALILWIFSKNLAVLIYLFLFVGFLKSYCCKNQFYFRWKTLWTYKGFEWIVHFLMASTLSSLIFFSLLFLSVLYCLCSRKELRGLISLCLSVEWMKLLNAVGLNQKASNFMILLFFKRFFNLVIAVIFVNLYLILIIERPHPLPRSSNIKVAFYFKSYLMFFVAKYAFS